MNKRAEIISSGVKENSQFIKAGRSFGLFKAEDSLGKVSDICSVDDLYNLYSFLRSAAAINKNFIDLGKVVAHDNEVLLKLIMSSSALAVSVRYFKQLEGYVVLFSKKIIFDEKEIDLLIFHLSNFRSNIFENTSFKLDAKLTTSQFIHLKKILLSFPRNINVTYNSWNDKNKVTLSSNDLDEDYLDNETKASFQFKETFIRNVMVDKSSYDDSSMASTKQGLSELKLPYKSIFSRDSCNLDSLDVFLNENTGAVNSDDSMDFKFMTEF